MRVIAFDPGKLTGYCTMQFHQYDDPTIVDLGEIKFDDLTDGAIRNITEYCTHCIVERAVLTGRINQDKVTQIRATERIVFYWESIRGKVQWINPESKKLCRAVPQFISGDHVRDAYRLLDAWRLMEDTQYIRETFD